MYTTGPHTPTTHTGAHGAPVPPAEVYIDVHPPVGHGRYSLCVYPRRLGDIVVYYTAPGLTPTHGRAREIVWIARGLGSGLALTISEKPSSMGKGHFGRIPPLSSVAPFQLSGPVLKGPPHGSHVIWSYQIVLSDGGGELAFVDPDVVIVPDP